MFCLYFIAFVHNSGQHRKAVACSHNTLFQFWIKGFFFLLFSQIQRSVKAMNLKNAHKTDSRASEANQVKKSSAKSSIPPLSKCGYVWLLACILIRASPLSQLCAVSLSSLSLAGNTSLLSWLLCVHAPSPATSTSVAGRQACSHVSHACWLTLNNITFMKEMVRGWGRGERVKVRERKEARKHQI